jgi:hypothetical protein
MAATGFRAIFPADHAADLLAHRPVQSSHPAGSGLSINLSQASQQGAELPSDAILPGCGSPPSYRDMLRAYGEPHDSCFELLHTFFDERFAFVWQELQDILSLSDSATRRITIPEDAEILVDGFPYHNSYHGVYFNATPVT